MFSPSFRLIGAAAVVAAVVGMAACGGGSPGGPNPLPSPSGNPEPSPTPRPTPTPTPDPRLNLAPGPVTQFRIKVRTVNNGERDAEQDDQGRWVVFTGERVDFDSTQKNAGGEICQWVNEPVWLIDGREMPMDSSRGLVYRRGSSQPFLLKLTMLGAGSFEVSARIDGIDSNVLTMRVRTP